MSTTVVHPALASIAAAACLAAHTGTQCDPVEVAKLTAADGAEDDRFGEAVSISGDVLVVGAPGRRRGDESGSTYVFRHTEAAWVEEAKLTASDGAKGDRFGRAVSISGEVAIIGAHEDDDNGDESGSAYVFRYDGGAWQEQTKLTASDGAEDDWFGRAVAIDGDVAVVGAFLDDDIAYDSGSAYVFRYDGDHWVEEQKLIVSGGAESDYLGVGVAVRGNTVVLGAYGDDDNGQRSGAVYVFRYDGNVWVEEAKLTASDGSAEDRLGEAVAIDGDLVLAGAIADDDHGSASGATYVFRHLGEAWVQEAKLTASDGGEDFFGYSVSVRGDVLVVGAMIDDDNGDESGSAYVFRFGDGSWSEDAKLIASDGAPVDRFGVSVCVSAGVAAIGAYGDDDNGSISGSAYVVELNCPSGCPADIDGSGDVDFDDLLRVLDAWGNKGGPEDLDGSGTVDFGDLLIVLDSWGPCDK